MDPPKRQKLASEIPFVVFMMVTSPQMLREMTRAIKTSGALAETISTMLEKGEDPEVAEVLESHLKMHKKVKDLLQQAYDAFEPEEKA